mmetsp:Transcript_32716/g.52188  ORF Transcript_32716/g.52188 Transcript_32716/m.52188 type:complete len:153 (+) Transcript_32716:2867-3325(+)
MIGLMSLYRVSSRLLGVCATHGNVLTPAQSSTTALHAPPRTFCQTPRSQKKDFQATAPNQANPGHRSHALEIRPKRITCVDLGSIQKPTTTPVPSAPPVPVVDHRTYSWQAVTASTLSKSAWKRADSADSGTKNPISRKISRKRALAFNSSA